MNHRFVRLGVPAVLLLGVIVVFAPAFLTGNWHGSHMGIRASALIHEFTQAFVDGQLYPRWMSDLHGGYGYPTFIFYQPGLFFTALPMSFFLLPHHALLWTLFLLTFVGASGAYLLAKHLTHDRITSLFCALLFLLTPYLFMDLYVRGAHAELMAMLLSPWSLFALLVLRQRVSQGGPTRWPVLGVAIAVAAVVYAHPIIAMFYLPLLIVFTLVLQFGDTRPHGSFLLSASSAIALGLLLSSPFWYTTLSMRPYVDLDAAFRAYFSAEGHTVYPLQLISRSWGFGISTVNDATDSISFQLGLPHLLLALAGLWFRRRNRFYQASAAIYGLLIIMMTPLADPLWTLRPLKYAQFPWRLLALTGVFQFVLASGLFRVWHNRPRRRAALMVLLLLCTAAWQSNQFRTRRYPVNVRFELAEVDRLLLQQMETFADSNEFLPSSVVTPPPHPRGDQPLIDGGEQTQIETHPEHTSQHIMAYLTIEHPTTIQLRQFYFPGWRIIVDDTDIEPEVLEHALDDTGLIRFDLDQPGTYLVEAYYDGPPGWRIRDLVIAFGLAFYLVFFFWERRRLKRG